ncbi:MAG: hypothetical protein HY959_03765 [Ignavibacteriae bacterium]|nr:hypothetical protein [Ignavibacteriota bacterium]
MPLSTDIIEVAKSKARNQLIDFEILTNYKYEPNWHHEEIAKALESIENGSFQSQGFKILILEVPPRHGKSQQATIDFPSWYLGRNPDKEVITSSYSAELALDFGGKTKNLVESPEYQGIFPNVRLRADEKSKAKWRTEQGGSYTAVGIGGAITGRGANVFIIDDPLKNREEANSIVIRNKQWEWFTSVAYTRLEPNGVIILILTRWHLDDLAGRILQHHDLSNVTKLICFPAIAIHDETFRKKGEPLWKSKYDLDALEQIKQTIGIYDWSALYQQNPILTENQEFKKEWFEYIDRNEIQRLNTRNFLTIDTALSDKEGADYTGLCENYVDTENKWNIAAYRMKLNPKDLIDYLFTIHDKRNFEKIGIERTAFTIGLKPYLDEEMRKRGKFLPIVELEHKSVQKEIRIRGLIPRYSSRSIYHITNECSDLENELLTFPKSINDDTMDATAYQLQIAESGLNKFERVMKRNEQKYVKNKYR